MATDLKSHIERWRDTHQGYANSYATSNLPANQFHLDVVHFIEEYETVHSDTESSPTLTKENDANS